MNSTTEVVSPQVEETGLDNRLSSPSHTTIDGPYAKYVLAILLLMGVFNYIDRQIFAILAEEIKADLSLSDGDLGFLFGTAFAVFYAVFGIPLGRLADSWYRTKQISLCVGFWSIMTTLSGLARSFVPLAVCRFGVAMGEAGATPAALSLLYDYFSPKVRTTVVGIYAAGASVGAGIGLFLGGAISLSVFRFAGFHWNCCRILDVPMVSALLWSECHGNRHSAWSIFRSSRADGHDIGWPAG